MKNEWYQCNDLPNFWARDKHQSCSDKGSVAIDGILNNSNNEGAIMIGHNTLANRFIVQDGTMLPLPNHKPSDYR